MAIQTRPPTGRVAPPLILLEGEEKSGKSWALAQLSASERVGRTLWVDLGEGAADEYGAIPGARYEVVIHDGTWQSLMATVTDARELAREARTAGEPPIVLGIDSMTQEWELLKDWTIWRARRSKRAKEILSKDPDAEIDTPPNYWNDANGRHRQLMAKLMTFPGIVVMIARGKETAAFDSNGRPIPNRKAYSVEGHKNLGYDASVWVRLSRGAAPLLIGARSVHGGVRPGVDRAERLDDFTLEKLVFGRLRYDPGTAGVRDLVIARDLETIREDALTKGVTLEHLQALWKEAKAADLHDVETTDAGDQPCTLRQLIEARAKAAGQQEPPAEVRGVTKPQLTKLGATFTEHGIKDRDQRLAIVSAIVGRQVGTSAELTINEASGVIETIDELAKIHSSGTGNALLSMTDMDGTT